MTHDPLPAPPPGGPALPASVRAVEDTVVVGYTVPSFRQINAHHAVREAAIPAL